MIVVLVPALTLDSEAELGVKETRISGFYAEHGI